MNEFPHKRLQIMLDDVLHRADYPELSEVDRAAIFQQCLASAWIVMGIPLPATLQILIRTRH